MAAIDKIVKNYEGASIAGNELLTNIVLNRLFKKLMENDIELAKRASQVSNGEYRILPWSEGKMYNENDLVWFVDCYLPAQNEEAYKNKYLEYQNNSKNKTVSKKDLEALENEYYTVTLYLLRSLKNGNTNIPTRTIVDMIPLFDASGWKNENPMGSIYTDYFQEFTVDNLQQQINNMHQAVLSEHPFGELRTFSDINSKILKIDMSNIDPNREKIFFPNETFALKETKSILNGTCRKWDCGLLEYDITFKLGDTDVEYNAYNTDGTLKLYEEINANKLNLAKSEFSTSTAATYDNRKYYLDDSDADIFYIENDESVVESGINQFNINSKINTFHGKITFQEQFIDTNYSIFPVNIPVVRDAMGNTVKNENTLVFVNKAKESVTAVFVIPNYNQSDYKILGDNIFKCRITGRWK